VEGRSPGDPAPVHYPIARRGSRGLELSHSFSESGEEGVAMFSRRTADRFLVSRALGDDRLTKEPISYGRKLRIIPTVNGPLLVRGEVEIQSADGEPVYRGSGSALCRCGYSENKPFCDGSHGEMGWCND
jgi:hypothetical protein